MKLEKTRAWACRIGQQPTKVTVDSQSDGAVGRWTKGPNDRERVRHACGCACAGGGRDVAPTEVDERRLEVALLLQEAEGSKSDDHTAPATTGGEVEKEAAVQFTVILMAIPITEFFIIYGMMNSDEELPPPADAGTRETDGRIEARDGMISRSFQLRHLIKLRNQSP
ncbi:hypothetical protein E2562_001902, partial [Oryza meyeriana var. granulata]